MEGQTELLIILGALLATSEALALIPSLKANGILHFVITFLKIFKGGLSNDNDKTKL